MLPSKEKLSSLPSPCSSMWLFELQGEPQLTPPAPRSIHVVNSCRHFFELTKANPTETCSVWRQKIFHLCSYKAEHLLQPPLSQLMSWALFTGICANTPPRKTYRFHLTKRAMSFVFLFQMNLWAWGKDAFRKFKNSSHSWNFCPYSYITSSSLPCLKKQCDWRQIAGAASVIWEQFSMKALLSSSIGKWYLGISWFLKLLVLADVLLEMSAVVMIRV